MDTSTKEIKDKKVDKCVKNVVGHKAPDIPWPPGKWRLGNPYKQSKYLFLRYATKG